MEKIISCNLNVGGSDVVYDVVFANEQYTFSPQSNEVGAPTFSFERDNDWIEVEQVDPEISKQAVKQLEDYLLSQH
jgi:hypothetical protein